MPRRTAGLLCLAVCLSAGTTGQAKSWRTFETFEEYASLFRSQCPAPFGQLRQTETREIEGVKYRLEGSKLVQLTKDKDRVTRVGLISAPKDGTTMTQTNIEAFLKAFQARNIDWLVANGDLAYDENDLTRVIDQLATAKVPVFAVIGNGESVTPFNDGLAKAMREHDNVFNLNLVRVVVGDDLSLVSLPGYYDRNYVHPPDGCVYKEADVNNLKELTQGLRGPVALVSHGPPRGEGNEAIDQIYEHRNVGDPLMAAKLKELKIPFGLFGHILEAGGRATDDVGNPLKPGHLSKSLLVNAGSASAIPWRMLDGKTSRGLAMIITVQGDQASYEVLTPGTAEAIVQGGGK